MGQDSPSLSDAVGAEWEERAALIEYDGGAPRALAEVTACPIVGATRIIAKSEQDTFIGRAANGDWKELSSELYRQVERVKAGNLCDAERMLLGQAAALQSLFVRLTERALGSETISNYDLQFRYALPRLLAGNDARSCHLPRATDHRGSRDSA
jgi:hypothetical protein